jgi:ABC-type transport system involved in cytochrome bd biosynthesis fused ATPase/permease subunit
MKHRYSLQGYDPRRPLKDNLTQVKNFVELVVSFLVASFLKTPFIVGEVLGIELTAQLIMIVRTGEIVLVYMLLSMIEYYLKGEDENR